MENKDLFINKTLGKKEIRFFINWFLKNFGTFKTKKLVNKLKNVGFKYVTLAGLSLGLEDLKIPFYKNSSFDDVEKKIYKFNINYKNAKVKPTLYTEKLVKFWNTTNDILKDQILLNFRQTNLLNPLYMMTLSGARGNISQIKQLVGMRGLMSDSQGQIIIIPIKSNFKEGLNVIEYFISCYGARKGIVDTALKTANSGYLTRRLIYATQNEFIKQPDCLTNLSTLVILKNKTKQYYLKAQEKLIGRVIGKSFVDFDRNLTIGKGQDICPFLFKKIMSCNKNKVFLRLIFSCKLNSGVCQLCYGWNLASGRIVELGETVGILAAQSIGEPGTQLTMRTFHTGGIFSGEVSQSVLSPQDGILTYLSNNLGKKIITKFYEKSFYTVEEKTIKVSNGLKFSLLKVPKNTLIIKKPGIFVRKNEVLAEIFKDNFKSKKKRFNKSIVNIKTDITGQVILKKHFFSILSGNVIYKKFLLSFMKKTITSKIVFLNPKYNTFFIKFLIKSYKSIYLKSFNYLFSFVVQSQVYPLLLVQKKNTNKKIFLDFKKFNIHVGSFLNKGIIKNTSFFSIYPSQVIEKRNKVMVLRKTKWYCNLYNKQKSKNSLIRKNDILFSSENKSLKTVDIVQGLPKIDQLLENRKTLKFHKLENTPQIKLNKTFLIFSKSYTNKIAVRKSLEKIQNYIVNQALKVYKSQGVSISDKHMEIVIKRMTSFVIIKEIGSSNFIVGEIIELSKVETFNFKLKKKILYEPLIIGISKIPLYNTSFISKSCFQETSKTFINSAVKGQVDWLYGLKENIALSNLIPVGTAFQF